MAKYIGKMVGGVLLWFDRTPSKLDQQKHDLHSSCGQCNKKYTRKPGKKYCSRRCKETAHKIRNIKKKGPPSSQTRGVNKALEEVLAPPLGQALSSIKTAPVVIKEPVRGILTRACGGCNGKFTPPSGQGRHKLFCTVKCRTKVRNKKASEKILQKKREIRAQPRDRKSVV